MTPSPCPSRPASDLRVGIHARVSSETQAEEGTIASQVQALQQRLAEEQLVLDPDLCFVDDGHSGTTLLRPALEKLRDAAAAGALDRLYVLNPDRLARKYAYQVLLVDELSRCGVQIVFLNRPLGQSPEDELLLQVQGMMAEYERAKILERARRGKLHAARAGNVSVMGTAPYGYRHLPKHRGGAACWQVNWEQAAVVRQIFRWVALERLTLRQVCRRLDQQGVPTAKGRPHWDRGSVRTMLANPAYVGRAAFGQHRHGPLLPRLRPPRGGPDPSLRGFSLYRQPPEQWVYIPVPAIVEEDLFAAVQEQLQENRRRRRERRPGPLYLLGGLLVCGCCGYALYGMRPSRCRGGKRTYYRCAGTDAYRHAGQKLCDNPSARVEELDALVWEDVQRLLSEPGRIEAEYRRRLEPPAGGGVERPSAQALGLAQRVQRSIERLIDAYEEGLLEKQELQPRLQAARQRLGRLQQEAADQARQEQQRRELRLVIGRLEAFAEQVRTGLATADWQTKRQILCSLVKRVEVHKDRVRIVYRVDPGPPASGGAPPDVQHCCSRPRTFPRSSPFGMRGGHSRHPAPKRSIRRSRVVPSRATALSPHSISFSRGKSPPLPHSP